MNNFFIKETLPNIVDVLIMSVDYKKGILNHLNTAYNREIKAIGNLEENIKHSGSCVVKSSNLKQHMQSKERIKKLIDSTKDKINKMSSAICALRAIKKGKSKKQINDVILKYIGDFLATTIMMAI